MLCINELLGMSKVTKYLLRKFDDSRKMKLGIFSLGGVLEVHFHDDGQELLCQVAAAFGVPSRDVSYGEQDDAIVVTPEGLEDLGKLPTVFPYVSRCSSHGRTGRRRRGSRT